MIRHIGRFVVEVDPNGVRIYQGSLRVDPDAAELLEVVAAAISGGALTPQSVMDLAEGFGADPPLRRCSICDDEVDDDDP